MKSIVSQAKQLEKEIKQREEALASLKKNLAGIDEIVKWVRERAEKHSIALTEVAFALVPSLEKNADKPEGKITRVRKLKRYKNPHNNEVVETKGGNNKTLKAWRDKYGSEVDNWFTIVE